MSSDLLNKKRVVKFRQSLKDPEMLKAIPDFIEDEDFEAVRILMNKGLIMQDIQLVYLWWMQNGATKH